MENGEKFARKCSCCGKGMNSGFVIHDEYACSLDCADVEAIQAGYEHYNNAYIENQEEIDGELHPGEVYWTQWESENDAQYIVEDGVLVDFED